jgi:4-amino-4-deoxy-L-arabinose transferase-like glycosyltransferase
MEPPIKASSFAGASITHWERCARWILPLLALLLFFFRLGGYPLFDLDEPRYAEAAREMIERGDWITPYFNYEVRFDKPVFFYWLIMLAYKLFGMSEFSARFSSAVASLLTLGMVYWFGKRWISERFGLISAAILATSAMFLGIGRMSITDMTLSMLMTGTSLCLFMAAHSHLRWWLMAGVFAGLAVLTKGPVGVIVPGAIFVIYTLLIGDFKRCILNRWLPLALILCLVIALPWYVLAYQANGPEFLNALLFHNVTRFSDTVSGHKQPIYFYALVLPLGFLPWTAYLPAAIRQFMMQARQGHHRQVQSGNANYLLPLYALVWIAFIFVFFTLSHTKLLTYILPLFPALALLTATGWVSDSEENASPWFTLPAALLTLGALIAGVLFNTQMGNLLPREAADAQANLATLGGAVILFAGLVITTWLFSKGKRMQAFASQTLVLSVTFLIAGAGILPTIGHAAQGLMLEYLQKTGGKPLMIYEMQRPSLTFYGRRRVPRFVEEQQSQLIAELRKNPQTFVILKNNYREQFMGLLPVSMHVEILEKDAVYSLLSVKTAPTRN